MDGKTITKAARSWIGTPYLHQASVKGQGCDCLGLLRGVWREILGNEPERIPAYTADWSEMGDQENLWKAAERNLISVPINTTAEGQILLFRMQKNCVAKHLGILASHESGFSTVIHAYTDRGVVETPLNSSWTRKIVAQFKFPQRSA